MEDIKFLSFIKRERVPRRAGGESARGAIARGAWRPALAASRRAPPIDRLRAMQLRAAFHPRGRAVCVRSRKRWREVRAAHRQRARESLPISRLHRRFEPTWRRRDHAILLIIRPPARLCILCRARPRTRAPPSLFVSHAPPSPRAHSRALSASAQNVRRRD